VDGFMHVTPYIYFVVPFEVSVSALIPDVVLRQARNYRFVVPTKNMFSTTSSLFHYLSSFIFEGI